jgi:hypothetical protein
VAVWEENVLPVPRATTASFARWGAVALVIAASALFAIRLDHPAFFDNEARYAEVAREMVLRGDWISPHLDFTLFLNKPPLTFWLVACIFSVAGPSGMGASRAARGRAIALPRRAGSGVPLRRDDGARRRLALATMFGFALEARALCVPTC